MRDLRTFGFRKIWKFTGGSKFGDMKLDELTYRDYINCPTWSTGRYTDNCPQF